MTDSEGEMLNKYSLDEAFEGNWDLYEKYLRKALAFLQDTKKSRTFSMRDVVPEYLEIEFQDIKSPRLFFPRFKGTVVVQLPSRGLSPRQRGTERERRLLQFAPAVKINEIAIADQFAMRMLIIESAKVKKSGDST